MSLLVITVHFLLMFCTIAVCRDARTEYYEIGRSFTGHINSSVFPQFCCEKKNYLIHAPDPDQPYLKMIFTDLDLQADAKLVIYNGNSSSSPPFYDQPTYHNGKWRRPVIASSGSDIYITLYPGKRHSYRNVGFRATVRASHREIWAVDKPFSDCPLLNDVMDGGMLKLRSIPASRRNPDLHIMFDCVWQISVPKSITNVHVFVRVDSINLVDGHVSIRDGLHSQAPLLANTTSTLHQTAAAQMTALNQDNAFVSGVITKNSKTGLYVAVTKPVDEGIFTFTYGVYQTTTATESNCLFKIGETAYNGFRCNVVSWCIPIDHRCDAIVNCPDGSDEDEKYCDESDLGSPTPTPTPTASPTGSTSTSTPCTEVTCRDGSCSNYDQECEENCHIGFTWCVTLRECRSVLVYQGNTYNACDDQGSCDNYQKECERGECVSFWEDCPTSPCSSILEKECNDGTCVQKLYKDCREDCGSSDQYCEREAECTASSSRCASQSCPNYKPNECEGSLRCYYNSDTCDGTWDCPGGEDEEHCEEEGGFAGIHVLYAIFVVFGVVLPIVLVKWSHNREQNNARTRANRGTEMRPLASAGNASNPTGTTTVNTTNTSSTPLITTNSTPATGGDEARPQPPNTSEPPPSYDEAVANSVPSAAATGRSTPPDSALPSYDSLTKTAPLDV